MLKKYKNQIFNLLKGTEIGLDNFEITELDADGRHFTKIVYKGSRLEFVIRDAIKSFEEFEYTYVKFTPLFNWSGYSPINGIDRLLYSIQRWILTELKDYIEEQTGPDLWEEYQKGDKSFNVNEIDFEDKKEFTVDEKEQIRLGLNELKALIHTQLKTTTEEQALINARLDYLEEASHRLNKFDWKGTAIQTLIAISINLSFDTQKGQQLFNLFKQVFAVIPKLVEAATQ